MRNGVVIILCIITAASCSLLPHKKETQTALQQDSIINDSLVTIYADTSIPLFIYTGDTKPQAVVYFAQTLIGVPYVYASSDPTIGFDCSGFITYVFNHFNITVPRSSIEFTNVPYEVPLADAKAGDLILFTGTDSTIRVVGHMGIVVKNENGLQFIHSTSGKANGVTITPLNDYYRGRFVKIVRVFPGN